MKKYRFLFRPLFFILCLVFASWSTLIIEKFFPSDFGRHKYLFHPDAKTRMMNEHAEQSVSVAKEDLKKSFPDYRAGLNDSVTREVLQHQPVIHKEH